MPELSRRERTARLFGGSGTAIEEAARCSGAVVAYWGKAGALRRRIAAFAPELICIAAFPHLIPEEFTSIARFGALNVHPSLLPRHRGTNPIFWTYFAGDRQSGVTVHRAAQPFDAGAIVAQESIPLPRGYPSKALARDLLELAGPLLVKAIDHVQSGRPEVPQQEELATHAPAVNLQQFRVPFGKWDVEQVWHFLAAYASSFREPLTDSSGRRVDYAGVAGFRRGPAGKPGSVILDGDQWVLNCLGGVVRLRP